MFCSRAFYDPGLAICALSLIVNTCLLPVYTTADRWQDEERALQRRMRPMLARIRAVFKGDERQMLIAAYYRQLGYSPLAALKSSVGLLLQVPFFIAAYQFLSHTPSLAGERFLFLADLSRPDGLLRLGGLTVNIMPILMTAVNLASALVYTKNLGLRDKVQLGGMALLFLVLLYPSASGLVLYWTCNNLFSLCKNLAVRFLNRGKLRPALALQVLAGAAGAALLIGALTRAFDVDRYTWLFGAAGAALIAGPFAFRALRRAASRLPDDPRGWDALFFTASAILALLVGLLIPLQVTASSVSDFQSPVSFVLRTFLQAASVFVLIPALIRAFAGPALRPLLALGGAYLALLALVCLFALSASYGLMTRSFKIEDPTLITRAFPLAVNALCAAACAVPVILAALFKRQRLLASTLGAAAGAVLIFAAVNAVSLGQGLRDLAHINEGGSPP
ncbi:MAG: YidC/Oxa1 family membrane protein insertase, partial [Treponema sp.]|nr:YidC/Oxa1 family membrane protein insertase [Treponema sp.]